MLNKCSKIKCLGQLLPGAQTIPAPWHGSLDFQQTPTTFKLWAPLPGFTSQTSLFKYVFYFKVCLYVGHRGQKRELDS